MTSFKYTSIIRELEIKGLENSKHKGMISNKRTKKTFTEEVSFELHTVDKERLKGQRADN